MNQGYTSFYESYIGDKRKLKEYQKRRAARPVPVARVEINEADFDDFTVGSSYSGTIYVSNGTDNQTISFAVIPSFCEVGDVFYTDNDNNEFKLEISDFEVDNDERPFQFHQTLWSMKI